MRLEGQVCAGLDCISCETRGPVEYASVESNAAFAAVNELLSGLSRGGLSLSIPMQVLLTMFPWQHCPSARYSIGSATTERRIAAYDTAACLRGMEAQFAYSSCSGRNVFTQNEFVRGQGYVVSFFPQSGLVSDETSLLWSFRD